MAAPQQPAHLFADGGRKRYIERQIGERALDVGSAGVEIQQIEHGAIRKHHAQPGIESSHAAGDGVEDELQLATAISESAVDFGELRGRALGKRAALLQVGGHGVERMNDLAQFFRRPHRDAVAVVAGADLLHGIGQGFRRARHLLGQVESQPTAGKQRKHGEQQHEQKVSSADTIAPTEELPVALRAGADSADSARETGRHGQRDHNQAGRRRGRGAEDIVDSAQRQDRLVAAMRGCQHKGGQRFTGGRSRGVCVVHPWTNLGMRHRSVARQGVLHHWLIIVVDDDEAAGERDAMTAYHAESGKDVLLVEAAVQGDGAGERFGFGAGIFLRILRELQCDAGGVFAQLRHRLREPAVDGAIQQQIAEEKHEQRWRETEDERAREQARPETRAEQPVLAVRVKLQHVAAEQHEQNDEQEEDENGKRGEKEDSVAVPRVQEAQIECIEGNQQKGREEKASGEQGYGYAAAAKHENSLQGINLCAERSDYRRSPRALPLRRHAEEADSLIYGCHFRVACGILVAL